MSECRVEGDMTAPDVKWYRFASSKWQAAFLETTYSNSKYYSLSSL